MFDLDELHLYGSSPNKIKIRKNRNNIIAWMPCFPINLRFYNVIFRVKQKKGY